MARKANTTLDHRHCRVDGDWDVHCMREAEDRQKWEKRVKSSTCPKGRQTLHERR